MCKRGFDGGCKSVCEYGCKDEDEIGSKSDFKGKCKGRCKFGCEGVDESYNYIGGECVSDGKC